MDEAAWREQYHGKPAIIDMQSKVLMSSVLYRLDCRDVYIHSSTTALSLLLMPVDAPAKFTAGWSRHILRRYIQELGQRVKRQRIRACSHVSEN